MENNELNSLLDNALTDLIEENEPAPSKNQSGDDKKGCPNIEESLKKISQVTRSHETEPKAGCSKKNHSIKNGGKDNKKNSKSFTDAVDEEEMNKFFANMSEQLKADLPKIDPDEAQARINESFPQIFDLMQNLLSKELLYPALKDLSPKFDEWLTKNEPKLSKAEKKRFRKQRDIINEIITTFDDENIEDQDRFVKNLELMEQMQSLGAPPEELTVPGQPKCPIM